MAQKWLTYAVGEDLYPTTKEQAVIDLRGGQSHVLVNSVSHFAISTFTLLSFYIVRKTIYFQFSESLFLV